jgi:hypothetical protein
VGALASVACAHSVRGGSGLGSQAGPSYHQWQGWFNEAKLDHFDETNDQTFSQRYFLIKDYWNAPHGPVIL